MLTKTATLFDRNELFRGSYVAHSPSSGHGGSASKGADFENAAVADAGKVIKQLQRIRMQHRLAFAHLAQAAVNGLVPVLHERVHQFETVIELVAIVHTFPETLHHTNAFEPDNLHRARSLP